MTTITAESRLDGDAESLVSRIIRAERPVVFLFGSALTVGSDGFAGIPGVPDMVETLSREMAGYGIQLQQRDHTTNSGEAYRQGFAAMVRSGGGQDVANRIIREAVLRAHAPLDPTLRAAVLRASPTEHGAACEQLMADLDGWLPLRDSLRALGTILANRPKQFPTVLTTNFDPLIEIAVRRAGGAVRATILARDGNPAQHRGPGTHIVYVHGYWFSADTMHTEVQLGTPRPALTSELRRVIDRSLLVVLGYGGWDDVLMSTLQAVTRDENARPDVVWGFYKDANESVTNILRTASERVQFYENVDMHRVLLSLARVLGSAQVESLGPSVGSGTAPQAAMAGISGTPEVNLDWQLHRTSVAGARPRQGTLTWKRVRKSVLVGLGVLLLIGAIAFFGRSPLAVRPIHLSVGVDHGCARKHDGGIWCWGAYRDSSDVFRSRPIPEQVTALHRNVEQISSGYYFNCALVKYAVWCWGENTNGDLGDGTQQNRVEPVQVIDIRKPIIQISPALGYGACALQGDGTVLCWGNNDSGQLGDGSTTARHFPVQVADLDQVVEVSAGFSHSCALRNNGTVWCWGNNSQGQLTNAVTTPRLTRPVEIQTVGHDVLQISAGGAHTCARKSDGTAWCWGFNRQGQVGNGTMSEREPPSPVVALGNQVAAISAGDGYTCALKQDGTVWCWGDNSLGQLGDGSFVSRHTARPVNGLGPGVVEIAVGFRHSCARRADDSVWCWGSNNNNALGNGTRDPSVRPTQVVGFDAR